MADIFENKLFLLLIVILQPVVFVISLEYLGYFGALAIPWSILILYLIWLWTSGKIPFASDEE